jgi:hypothetical protein
MNLCQLHRVLLDLGVEPPPVVEEPRSCSAAPAYKTGLSALSQSRSRYYQKFENPWRAWVAGGGQPNDASHTHSDANKSNGF